jgi:hypothetical protein
MAHLGNLHFFDNANLTGNYIRTIAINVEVSLNACNANV